MRIPSGNQHIVRHCENLLVKIRTNGEFSAPPHMMGSNRAGGDKAEAETVI